MINPWMSRLEIETIEKYLKPSFKMLEYGSGGSTLYFSRLVQEYYSVEHDAEWYEKITKILINPFHTHKISKYSLVEVAKEDIKPAPVQQTPVPWSQLETSDYYYLFEKYIKEPSKFGAKFDAVLIDGRARPECAKFIYNFLSPNAYVFIHDYWPRLYYHVVEDQYRVIDHVKAGQSLVVLQK